MARVASAVGVLLAALIAVGTWLYVAGVMPPFPWNAWAFSAALWTSIGLALAFGR